jgi:lipopolysaccharide biosynthesis glycosyltransferase
MNVLYCLDANVQQGLILSVLSLLGQVKEGLHIYVLTLDFTFQNKKISPVQDDVISYLQNKLQEQNENNSIRVYEMSDYFQKEVPDKNMSTRFTPCCMLRLFADEIDLPERILYLDTDVLCRKDPSAFYHQSLEQKEMAGVLDYYGSWFFYRKPFERSYMNSGVLLLNLKEIKKSGLFKNCRYMCTHKEMFMPDQSAINKLVERKVLCQRKYNEQRRLQDDTVFQHFTTSFRFFPIFHTVSVKPWQMERVHDVLKIHEYDALFETYQKDMAQLSRN